MKKHTLSGWEKLLYLFVPILGWAKWAYHEVKRSEALNELKRYEVVSPAEKIEKVGQAALPVLLLVEEPPGEEAPGAASEPSSIEPQVEGAPSAAESELPEPPPQIVVVEVPVPLTPAIQKTPFEQWAERIDQVFAKNLAAAVKQYFPTNIASLKITNEVWNREGKSTLFHYEIELEAPMQGDVLLGKRFQLRIGSIHIPQRFSGWIKVFFQQMEFEGEDRLVFKPRIGQDHSLREIQQDSGYGIQIGSSTKKTESEINFVPVPDEDIPAALAKLGSLSIKWSDVSAS